MKWNIGNIIFYCFIFTFLTFDIVEFVFPDIYIQIIFFQGLRGAVAFAQSLHLPLANETASRMIMTTTLAITVFTNVVLGGFTLPLVKVITMTCCVLKGAGSRNVNKLLSKRRFCSIFDGPCQRDFPLLPSKLKALSPYKYRFHDQYQLLFNHKTKVFI